VGDHGDREKKQVSNFVPEKETDVTVTASKTNSAAVKYEYKECS
jgi:hypothetical protein